MEYSPNENEYMRRSVVLVDRLCPKCIYEIEHSPNFHHHPECKTTFERWLSIVSEEIRERILEEFKKVPENHCVCCDRVDII